MCARETPAPGPGSCPPCCLGRKKELPSPCGTWKLPPLSPSLQAEVQPQASPSHPKMNPGQSFAGMTAWATRRAHSKKPVREHLFEPGPGRWPAAVANTQPSNGSVPAVPARPWHAGFRSPSPCLFVGCPSLPRCVWRIQGNAGSRPSPCRGVRNGPRNLLATGYVLPAAAQRDRQERICVMSPLHVLRSGQDRPPLSPQAEPRKSRETGRKHRQPSRGGGGLTGGGQVLFRVWKHRQGAGLRASGQR